MRARPISSLRRLLEPPASQTGAGACHACGAELAREHDHVADLEDRRFLCLCAACAARAPADGSSRARFRALPQRYSAVAVGAIEDPQWDACEIPVGIAFFFYNSALARAVACYPSPAGATESLLPSDRWSTLLDGGAGARGLLPDVEALLIRRTAAAQDAFIVPVTVCYELVGRIRRSWTGLTGGEEVRAEIDAFFASLRDRSHACA